MTGRVRTTELPTLRCRGLRLRFGARPILDGLDLDVGRGEALAIMGPSGSGKTSLLHCLAGLRQPDAGDISVAGAELTRMSHRQRARVRLNSIGMVFQFGELLDELTVGENVELPLRLRRERGTAAGRLLGSVGLADRGGSWPAELSGGEVQRVAIARALAGRPVLLLADEPTGALDEGLSRAVGELLRSSASAVGAALVVATHDPIVASSMDRTARLRHGQLVAA
ncbi:MAG: ABC transporter ATP-binding protein [Acidimicrobiales bacterium]|nr:ABC transporter ATP-binding protein [Acidimicrobiales bacterium]